MKIIVLCPQREITTRKRELGHVSYKCPPRAFRHSANSARAGPADRDRSREGTRRWPQARLTSISPPKKSVHEEPKSKDDDTHRGTRTALRGRAPRPADRPSSGGPGARETRPSGPCAGLGSGTPPAPWRRTPLVEARPASVEAPWAACFAAVRPSSVHAVVVLLVVVVSRGE